MSYGVLPHGWKYLDHPDGACRATNGHTVVDSDTVKGVWDLVWEIEEKNRDSFKRGTIGINPVALTAP